ncbi:hypothetical protein GY45DRAFT_1104181 [Cubamyces sp. BRFM 1775]|nr:hypothetical protein GY45DRAFT_1104181 [Cubamyces sp. BRFM 1775]
MSIAGDVYSGNNGISRSDTRHETVDSCSPSQSQIQIPSLSESQNQSRTLNEKSARPRGVAEGEPCLALPLAYECHDGNSDLPAKSISYPHAPKPSPSSTSCRLPVPPGRRTCPLTTFMGPSILVGASPRRKSPRAPYQVTSHTSSPHITTLCTPSSREVPAPLLSSIAPSILSTFVFSCRPSVTLPPSQIAFRPPSPAVHRRHRRLLRLQSSESARTTAQISSSGSQARRHGERCDCPSSVLQSPCQSVRVNRIPSVVRQQGPEPVRVDAPAPSVRAWRGEAHKHTPRA